MNKKERLEELLEAVYNAEDNIDGIFNPDEWLMNIMSSH